VLDRPDDGGAEVADLAIDDRQPFVLITTSELRRRSLSKITVVLGVPALGGYPVGV
jgi:hypothetical protein